MKYLYQNKLEKPKKDISLVIPIYNNENIIQDSHCKLEKALNKISRNYENLKTYPILSSGSLCF